MVLVSSLSLYCILINSEMDICVSVCFRCRWSIFGGWFDNFDYDDCDHHGNNKSQQHWVDDERWDGA